MAADLRALALLLNAGDKGTIQRCFARAFFYRTQPEEFDLSFLKEALEIEQDDAARLAKALLTVVDEVLYEDDPAAVATLLESKHVQIDARLLNLIQTVTRQQLPAWREASKKLRPALPKLVDMDWRVDVAASTTAASVLNVPSVIVSLQVQEQPTRRDAMPRDENVTFELRRDALQTMLDGLGRIRDQLASVNANQ